MANGRNTHSWRNRLLLVAAITALPLPFIGAAFAEEATTEAEVTTEIPADATVNNSFDNFETLPEAPEPEGNVVDITEIDPPIEVAPEPEPEPKVRSMGRVVASYYGKRFHGRLTANGERFNMNAMTAAHKTLPFGTRVRITNPRNGKAVTVRINDRGPYIRGRTIDLSKAAARKIGIIQSGHGRVQMDILR